MFSFPYFSLSSTNQLWSSSSSLQSLNEKEKCNRGTARLTRVPQDEVKEKGGATYGSSLLERQPADIVNKLLSYLTLRDRYNLLNSCRSFCKPNLKINLLKDSTLHLRFHQLLEMPLQRVVDQAEHLVLAPLQSGQSRDERYSFFYLIYRVMKHFPSIKSLSITNFSYYPCFDDGFFIDQNHIDQIAGLDVKIAEAFLNRVELEAKGRALVGVSFLNPKRCQREASYTPTLHYVTIDSDLPVILERGLSQLRKLTFSINGIHWRGPGWDRVLKRGSFQWATLLTLTHRSSNLTEIDLSDIHMSPLSHFNRSPYLKKMGASNLNMKPYLQSEELRGLIKLHPQLTAIKVPTFIDDTTIFSKLGARCAGLVELSMAYSDMSKYGWGVLRDYKNLTHLDLCGIRFMDTFPFEILGQHCKRLTELDLTESKLDDSHLVALAEGCAQLTWLNIDCYLPSPQTLCVTDRGVEALAKNCSNLTYLNLSNPHIGISLTGLEALIAGCKQLARIAFGDLGQCLPTGDVWRVNDLWMKKVAKGWPHLTEIRLFGTGVTDEGMASLITGCPKLSRLVLRKVGEVTDKSMETLAKSSLQLSQIELSSVKRLTVAGIERLFQRPHTQLTTFRFHVSPPLQNLSLRTFAQSCPQLTELALSGSKGDLEALAEGCKELTDLSIGESELAFAALEALLQHCPQLRSIGSSRACFSLKADQLIVLAVKHPRVEFS